MRSVWRQSRTAFDIGTGRGSASGSAVFPDHDVSVPVQSLQRHPVPPATARVAGVPRHTTGLGLPLARAIARSCGGWVGIDRVSVSTSAKEDLEMAADVQTMLVWGVLEAPSTSSSPSPPPPPSRSSPTPHSRHAGYESPMGTPDGALSTVLSPVTKPRRVASLEFDLPTCDAAVNLDAGGGGASGFDAASVRAGHHGGSADDEGARATPGDGGGGGVVGMLRRRGVTKKLRRVEHFRVVFVDDELPNRRIGERLCRRLGISKENFSVLCDGACVCARARVDSVHVS